jgi:iron complex outermembrane receptor protein
MRCLSSITDVLQGQILAVYLATRVPTKVDYYTSWDLQFSYTFDRASAERLWSFLKGVTVRVGVNDLFNRMPPYSPLAQPANLNSNNADVATYSPIGRLFFFSASAKF